MSNIIKFFPKGYKPREMQIEILDKIQEAIKQGNKFIVISSPTGTGKSLFAASLANMSPNPSKKFVKLVDDQLIFKKNATGDFIYSQDALNEPSFGAITLTISKALQDQYDKLFDNSALLKGKKNYQCNVDERFDTEAAPCMLSSKLLKECKENRRCEYLNARDYVIKSKFGVLNYSMFLSLPDHVKKRSIIVCDEASELEDKLVNYFSVTINYDKLDDIIPKNKKLISESSATAQLWLTDLAMQLEEFIHTYMNKLTSKKIKQPSFRELTRYKNLKNLHEKIIQVLKNWNECEYVIEKNNEQATFVPLYVNILSDSIFKFADTVILMSATIIDHKTFTKTLGIKDYKYIEVDSTFDPKKSPVYCAGKYNLNYKNININLPKVVNQALMICNHYKGKNGIIHTHNFKITKGIQARVRNNKRFLFREGAITNEHILEEHFIREDGTVLVSPSLNFGTDLPAKHGEFQIIMKLPFLPLGSKRVKMLFDKDKQWYQMKMLVNLLQMSGRIIRSGSDSGETFILDGQAFSILKREYKKLPKHFRDRLQ